MRTACQGGVGIAPVCSKEMLGRFLQRKSTHLQFAQEAAAMGTLEIGLWQRCASVGSIKYVEGIA